jgi:hypothetical protein
VTDSTNTRTGRALRDPAAVVREGRRMVGLERHYRCAGCGAERRSWSRMSSCPDCGRAYVAAVIRRAAFA